MNFVIKPMKSETIKELEQANLLIGDVKWVYIGAARP